MTWGLAVAVLAGAGIGAGLWVGFTPARQRTPDRPSPVDRARSWLAGPGGLRILAGVGAGVAVLVLTRWVPVAAAVSAAVIAWPALFGAAAEQRVKIARLEALAAWIEALRDTIATSRGLPEALPAASARAQSALAGPLQEVVVRMGAREPVETVLHRLADDIDDPIADAALAALILNYRTQGRELKTALTGLAAATRREVETRRTVEAERRSTSRAVTVVMVTTVAMTLAMAVLMREYAAPYSTLTGQLVLTVVVALFAAGFAVIRRLSRYTTPDRFLGTAAATVTAPRSAASSRPSTARGAR